MQHNVAGGHDSQKLLAIIIGIFSLFGLGYHQQTDTVRPRLSGHVGTGTYPDIKVICLDMGVTCMLKHSKLRGGLYMLLYMYSLLLYLLQIIIQIKWT